MPTCIPMRTPRPRKLVHNDKKKLSKIDMAMRHGELVHYATINLEPRKGPIMSA